MFTDNSLFNYNDYLRKFRINYAFNEQPTAPVDGHWRAKPGSNFRYICYSFDTKQHHSLSLTFSPLVPKISNYTI